MRTNQETGSAQFEFALKGRGFSRAVSIERSIAALAAAEAFCGN